MCLDQKRIRFRLFLNVIWVIIFLIYLMKILNRHQRFVNLTELLQIFTSYKMFLKNRKNQEK